MEEDFVFLHSSSTFFSWMAVAHIHTSIQKEAFTRSPGFMIINIILRTITLTLMSRHTLQKLQQQQSSLPRKQLHLSKHLSNNLFSLPFSFLYSLSIETHPHLLSCMFSFSLKLKTHHLLLCTMWPNNFIDYI